MRRIATDAERWVLNRERKAWMNLGIDEQTYYKKLGIRQ